MDQGTMIAHQYVAKFVEFLYFATNLILDEEKKAQKFEKGLNYRIYEQVVGFQILSFSKLVNKALAFEQSLKE